MHLCGFEACKGFEIDFYVLNDMFMRVYKIWPKSKSVLKVTKNVFKPVSNYQQIFYTFMFKMARFCSNHLQAASKFFSSDSHLKISFKSILKVHFFHLQSKIMKNIFKPVSNFHKNFQTILFKMAKFCSNHLQNHEKISFSMPKPDFLSILTNLFPFLKPKACFFQF